ncbi:hypothetical protein L873DRAFT_1791232 [Choiromyces venosus 120613-1]|uniref:Uncharacterized protein n=1 Tax=Choiromyces venosus 120613-1 TaxID=1336337 RepID=A0A3N4JJA8_9PEZI|nr:hypothetical protein L873DRAFT_1791232 [Choiromyces venosus 120613-1]
MLHSNSFPPANSAFDTRTGGLALRVPYSAACALLPDKNVSPSSHAEHVRPSHISNISHPGPPPGSPSNSHEPKPGTISNQCASAFESLLPPPLPSPIKLPATPMQKHAITLLNEPSSMVCGAEDYTWALFDLVPSGRMEGYSVSWKSGEPLWTAKKDYLLEDCACARETVGVFGYPPALEDLVSG